MTGDLQRRLLAGRHRACMSGGMLSACLSCKELTEAADEIERLTKSNTILRDALEQIITGVWSYLQSFVDPYTCGRHSKIERKIRK